MFVYCYTYRMGALKLQVCLMCFYYMQRWIMYAGQRIVCLEGAADEHITVKRDRFNHQSTISSQLCVLTYGLLYV